MPSGNTRGVPPVQEPNRCRPQHLYEHDDQEQDDRDRRDRFVFPMAVRVVAIWRPPRHRHADERHNVRPGIGQRVEPVRDDRDRARRIAEDDFGDRDQRG